MPNDRAWRQIGGSRAVAASNRNRWAWSQRWPAEFVAESVLDKTDLTLTCQRPELGGTVRVLPRPSMTQRYKLDD